MRDLLTLILFFSLFFVSCDKNEEIVNNQLKECEIYDTGNFYIENQHTRTIIVKIFTMGPGGGLSKSFEIEPGNRELVTIKAGNYGISATYKGESSNFSAMTWTVNECDEGAIISP